METLRRFCEVYRLTYRHMRDAAKFQTPAGDIPRHVVATHKKRWSSDFLKLFDLQLEIGGTAPGGSPVIFVGNHISYLDIPVMMAAHDVAFVAKYELSKWPAVGRGIRLTNTILVKRGSRDSRKHVAAQVAEKVLGARQSAVIFPSATTAWHQEPSWRTGAFRIAQEHGIPICPFRLWYEPGRPVAYIDDDAFPLHMWKLLQLRGLRARLEIHPAVSVEDPKVDAERWRRWTMCPSFRGSVGGASSQVSASPVVSPGSMVSPGPMVPPLQRR